MSDLAYHLNLKKGLDTITSISGLVNERQSELVALDEELISKRGISEAIDRKVIEFKREEKEHRMALSALQSELGRVKEEKDVFSQEVRELQEMSAAIVSEISKKSTALSEVQGRNVISQEEVNKYIALRNEKLSEYEKVRSDLDDLRAEMEKETARLNATTTRIGNEKETQEQKWREIDSKESALVARDKYLKTIEKRLIKYAEKLNITL